MIIEGREKDLGGFSVRRVLPFARRRMVGPFIFFDHMGPADIPAGQGMNVRPHPHINLATVTYLFEGKIHHRDSLGSSQLIEPGAVNWMTAGHGIVHSERSPEEMIKTGGRMNGIQLWVALPEEFEEAAPTFFHHPTATLPEFMVGQVKVKLLLGKAFEKTSPVQVHSDLFYFEAQMPMGSELVLPLMKNQEAAAYVVTGKLRSKISGEVAPQYSMFVAAESDASLHIAATEKAHVMILGGASLSERHIFWNFVSSSKERIEQAKAEWKNGGPRTASSRFQPVPGDSREYIPLPDE